MFSSLPLPAGKQLFWKIFSFPINSRVLLYHGMNSDPNDGKADSLSTAIFPSATDASKIVAREISDAIRSRNNKGQAIVLGLATGSTPIKVYQELVRLHKEESLSFANVRTFNLDEYYGLSPTHAESYNAFMKKHLFSSIDIPSEAAIVPDGMVPREEVFAYCDDFEKSILDAGGIDIQVLGIGRTGHIGFNEPGSSRSSRTRLVHLDSITKKDAAQAFGGAGNVPPNAITMGVETILAARKIYLLAWGAPKAKILAKALEDPISEKLPASFLQEHKNTNVFLDQAAAVEITKGKNR